MIFREREERYRQTVIEEYLEANLGPGTEARDIPDEKASVECEITYDAAAAKLKQEQEKSKGEK